MTSRILGTLIKVSQSVMLNLSSLAILFFSMLFTPLGSAVEEQDMGTIGGTGMSPHSFPDDIPETPDIPERIDLPEIPDMGITEILDTVEDTEMSADVPESVNGD